MKIRFNAALLIGALVLCQSALAQGRGGSGGGGRGQQDNLVSPEVHPDRTVTFRLRAPQASVVTLTGDWLATLATSTGGAIPMAKDSTGVWSVTTPPLEATVHLYFFTMDGVTMADPVNPKLKLRTRTSASLVEVPGDPIPVWQVRDVSHGSVDWNWQHSTVYNLSLIHICATGATGSIAIPGTSGQVVANVGGNLVGVTGSLPTNIVTAVGAYGAAQSVSQSINNAGNSFSNGTDTVRTYRNLYYFNQYTYDIRIVYTNAYYTNGLVQTGPGNAVTLTAGLEYNGVTAQVTWNGQTSVSVPDVYKRQEYHRRCASQPGQAASAS